MIIINVQGCQAMTQLKLLRQFLQPNEKLKHHNQLCSSCHAVITQCVHECV